MAASALNESVAPDGRLHEVTACLDGGDAATALTLLRPLLAGDAPSLAARFALAITAWRLERFDWALSLLKECHAEAPDDGRIAEALASLEAQLGNLEESLFVGKLATALGGDSAVARLTPRDYPSFDRAFLSIVERPLLGKARAAFAEGRLRRAIEMARQHVAIDPQDLEGRAFRADCLLRAGAAGDAVETLRVLDEVAAPAAAHASLYARALAAVGEREGAARWHRKAAAVADEDFAIAAARIADAPFLGCDAAEIEQLSHDWLRRFALQPKPAHRHVSDKKLVVGYLVSAFLDAEDAAAVAAAARAHDRTGVTVLGFGLGSQTAEQNGALTGAFTRWRDIGALDSVTLARIWSGDGIDVLVDAGGFAAPKPLRALTGFATGLRVSWLGNPGGILTPAYDVRLAAADYPVLDGCDKVAMRGEAAAFGADVSLAQLDAPTVALWSAILEATPGAKLVLRARDMEGANLDRLIHRFGRAIAARIDLRRATQASDFYEAVDIALLPLAGVSPRAAAEAVANGVAAIAMAGEPYGAFLSRRGLGHLVAADAAGYCAIAARLARSAEARVVLQPLVRGAAVLAQQIEKIARAASARENAA